MSSEKLIELIKKFALKGHITESERKILQIKAKSLDLSDKTIEILISQAILEKSIIAKESHINKASNEIQNQNESNNSSKGTGVLLFVIGVAGILAAMFGFLPKGIDGIRASTGMPAFNLFHDIGLICLYGGIGLILVGGIIFASSFFKSK